MATQPLAPLVQQVLSSPTAEPAMQRQILTLANDNLHQDGMTTALVASLAHIRSGEIRRAARHLVLSLDSGRFADLAAMHTALLAELHWEEDRTQRSALILRLARGLGQDARLPAAVIGLLAGNLPDSEAQALMAALRALPQRDAATVCQALAQVAQRSAALQVWAVEWATTGPDLPAEVITALMPFLNDRLPAALRVQVLQRLQAARVRPAEVLSVLQRLATADADTAVRIAALDLLAAQADADSLAVITQVAAHDADDTVRVHATGLLGRAGAGVDADTLRARLADPDPQVRQAALAQARPQIRQEAVRAALVAVFSAEVTSWRDEELQTILELLAPYAARDAGVRATLLTCWTTLPRPQQRALVVEIVLPRLRVADIAEPLAAAFAHETDEALRAALFALLQPLSLARHPDLVAVFAQELTDPSSLFRVACATALGAVAEDSAAAVAALADVLTHDTDRALVRTCLDGYLRPGVTRHAAPLLAVIDSQELDTQTRQRALTAVVTLDLTADDQARLAAVLAGPGARALQRP